MSAQVFAAEVMAQPEGDRLGYALDLLAFYLDPVDAFYDGLADLGLRLSAQEARILHALDRRRGRFVSLQALLAAAMGSRPVDDWPEAKVIYARLCTLREALTRSGLPVAITAWPEIGYRLEAPAGFRFERPA